MFEKMALLLDTSELAENAIPYAWYLASRMGSEIDLISVCEPEGTTGRVVSTYLDKIIGEIKEPVVKKKRSVLLYGKAADQIIDYSERNKIDTIVMATHGHSGIKRWFIGSIADKIIRGTRIPTLLINCKEKCAVSPQALSFKHILLPLDGSKTAESALPYVEALAANLGARVTLIRIISPLIEQYAGPPEGFVVDYNGKIMMALEEEAKDNLNQTAKYLREKGISVASSMSVGSPTLEILNFIDKQKVDLVVMSTHGRTGVGRFVLGSIADKLLHSVEVPLLLIRS